MRTHDAMRRRVLAALALAPLPAVAAPARGPAVVRVATDALDVAYVAAGPEKGRPVVLVHDLGYDVHSFTRVAPLLAGAGLRVLVPWLRGHGGTYFRAAAAPRSARQAALGRDLIDFIDALHLPEAVFAGFGWGAHAARAASRARCGSARRRPRPSMTPCSRAPRRASTIRTSARSSRTPGRSATPAPRPIRPARRSKGNSHCRPRPPPRSR